MLEGDYAAGAGELAGVASGYVAPDVYRAEGNVAGQGLETAGRGLERGSVAIQNFKRGTVPGLAALDAVLHASPKAAIVAAAPYAGEYAGRAMQRVGRILQGLSRGSTSTTLEPSQAPSTPTAGGFAQQPRSVTINRPDAPWRGPANTEPYWNPNQTITPASTPTFPPSIAALDGPTFSDWAKDIDDIVNAATPSDLAQFPGRPSRLSKAWRDFLTRKRAEDEANGVAARPTTQP